MVNSELTLIKSELFKQGGLEKYTWQIAYDFCSMGIPVTLLTSGHVSPPRSDPNLRIVSVSADFPFSFFNLLQFDKACHRYLEQYPTSVVFSLDRNRFQTHIRAGNGVHAAYLKHRSKEEGLLKKASFALNPLHRAILSLEKKAFEHPGLKVLFANSEMVKEQILEHYAVDPKKICVVHNGVEWQAMQNPFDCWEEKKEQKLQELSLDPSAFQFLFIGHNFRRKGLAKLLHALSLMKNEDFQLSVVGRDKNLRVFVNLAERLGLKGKVFFFGPRKESLSFYQIADCTIIPSLYDPFANVTVESLAMGVPVITSQYNGGCEVIAPINGSVVSSLDDPILFASTLKSSLLRPKVQSSACIIRESIKHLDFSKQLRVITERTMRNY
jgi:UDP-glucose:(heptosyl)LPS alpha-1,3-glucosyltransferase